MIDNQLYHFGPKGLYNGLILLGDDETGSYWDHMTGLCVHGTNKGKKMEVFPIEHKTVSSALQETPELQIAFSKPSMMMRIISPIMKRAHRKAFLPPGFRKTMGEIDHRLPEMTSGLGVITTEVQRFYSIDKIKENGGEIRDIISGTEIVVYLNSDDQVPYAETIDQNTPFPMQLFTRWYGFSLTYPKCEIYN